MRPARFRLRLDRAGNILVVKLDFAGDWIMTTPLLDELRRRAPRARITAVVIDRAFDLADADPAVDRVISISWARGRRLGVGASNPARLGSFVADYTGGAFDLALVPRWDTDFNGAAQLAFGSRAPLVVGFSERSTAAKALSNRGDDRFYTDLVHDTEVLHEAGRQLTLLTAFGPTAWREAPVRAAFTPDDSGHARDLIKRGFDETRPILAVAPFVDQGRRTLPANLLVPIIRRLVRKLDMDVAVVGAPDHAGRAAALARSLGRRAVSFAGRLTLRQMAAFTARAAAMIAMDSGSAHIAAGVGTPVVVFSCHPADGPVGHPQSPVRFAPRAAPGMVLVLQPERALPTCRNGCERDEAHCIRQLDEARVWSRLRPFLAAALDRARSGN